jgi:hypothetical protein
LEARLADMQKLIMTTNGGGGNNNNNLMSKSLYGNGSQTTLGDSMQLRRSQARDTLFDFGGDTNNVGRGFDSSGGLGEQQIINLMRKGFEDFERHITLKLNEEKLRTQGELNVSKVLYFYKKNLKIQAELTLKMMDEFRIRLTEVENMQNKLNASVDILDIRTKGGIGS